MGADLQTIRAKLKDRIAAANTLIVVTGNHSTAAETQVKQSMEALRRIIDEHERSTLLQISTLRAQEKNELDNYKDALERHLQECDLQMAKLTILATDGTKLMRSKADFEASIRRSNDASKEMQIPRRKYHHIHGIDQLEMLNEQIAQYGLYARCHNPELEKRIIDSQGQNQLQLNGMNLTPADMKVVVTAVRSDKVSNGEVSFAFSHRGERSLSGK